ncbi:hypothetical membrane protein [Pelotomaculum thermopropionicum SI]|uniref:Hypothetical membrane protein n=1 Tax=Pelotomaculum thermopropionicum (strain DSM 13744 / JCM 10971 / SI) TaxID=370438 RepID=A5CYY1_PELTS|nr:hypothetical membrane protein [Pelotomaculum thermopropionicum SI]
MNLFAWLFIGHLVGDFLLQTNWMAVRKTTSLLALTAHVTVYTLSVAVFALPDGGISYKAAALIFATHLIIDRRGFVNLWVRQVNKAEGLQWLHVVSDQCWHLLVLALATLL